MLKSVIVGFAIACLIATGGSHAAARSTIVGVTVTNQGKETMDVRLSDGPGRTLSTFRLGVGRSNYVSVRTDEWVRCQASCPNGLTGTKGKTFGTAISLSFRIEQVRRGVRPTVH